MIIQSNLKKILDEREISIRKAARDIEYRFDSVRQMYNDDLKTYPKELLTRLCVYLEVTPGDLIVIRENDPDK